MSDKYPRDLGEREVVEVRARRHELVAQLIRRGEDRLPALRGRGLEWVWEGCTRRGALESATFPLSSEDFREACILAGFDPEAELALVRARAASNPDPGAPDDLRARATKLAATLRSAKASATRGTWCWWTSNSHRRLSSSGTGPDGDVAHAFVARDGVPDISISDPDMHLIEVACSAAGEVANLLDALVSLLGEPRGGTRG